jgi:hypothetical protein
MSRQHPRETIYDILHKKLKLQSMEENTKELEYQIDGLGNTFNTTLSQTV